MDKTVAKVMKVVEAMARTNRPLGVTDLAKEVGLTKSNAHRLLRTLLALGYVSQGQDSLYRLSLKLWELGAHGVQGLELIEVARPIVRDLCLRTDESVQLAVPEGLSMVYVDKADSAHPLRATTAIGSRVPAHAVSSGKAVLAFSPDMSQLLKYPLKRYTPKTLTSEREMTKALARIRLDGYAVNAGEWRPGIWGVAAPIHDAMNQTVAAMGVWGAESRFREATCERIGRQVVEAAEAVSKGLGYLRNRNNSARNEGRLKGRSR